ncbi:hypothetical protein CU097_001822, partial [Rhizopus azygosporus]
YHSNLLHGNRLGRIGTVVPRRTWDRQEIPTELTLNEAGIKRTNFSSDPLAVQPIPPISYHRNKEKHITAIT